MKTLGAIALVELRVTAGYALTFEDFRMLSTGAPDGQVLAYVGQPTELCAEWIVKNEKRPVPN